MPRRHRDEIDLLTAAYMASLRVPQSRISLTLGVSQAVVSRLVQEAEVRGFLKREVRFVSEEVSQERMARVMERLSRKDLSENLARFAPTHGGRRPPILRVFFSESGDQTPAAFVQQAALYIRQLMSRSRICGVAWGGMLWHLSRALRSLNAAAPWAKEPIQFVPLSGEPLGCEPLPFSSSILAAEFHRIANARPNPQTSIETMESLYLGAIPAFLPATTNEQERKAFWRLLSMSDSYAKIFGKVNLERTTAPSQEDQQDGLAWKLDTILTSTGPAERALGFGVDGKLIPKDAPPELPELILGDIGGVCLPKTSLLKEAREKLESVTSRWTGLTLDQIRACATRAAQTDPLHGPPGVVVVSSGAARAKIIVECVRRGLVNHLIVDHPLSEELNRELRQELGDRAARPAESPAH